MSDFTLKEGDTSPAIRYQLQDDRGNPVALNGVADVKFLFKHVNEDQLIVEEGTNGGVTVVNPEEGIVEYAWSAQDTEEDGHYRAEWEVEYNDGSVETFPNTRDIRITINQDAN